MSCYNILCLHNIYLWACICVCVCVCVCTEMFTRLPCHYTQFDAVMFSFTLSFALVKAKRCIYIYLLKRHSVSHFAVVLNCGHARAYFMASGHWMSVLFVYICFSLARSLSPFLVCLHCEFRATLSVCVMCAQFKCSALKTVEWSHTLGVYVCVFITMFTHGVLVYMLQAFTLSCIPENARHFLCCSAAAAVAVVIHHASEAKQSKHTAATIPHTRSTLNCTAHICCVLRRTKFICALVCVCILSNRLNDEWKKSRIPFENVWKYGCAEYRNRRRRRKYTRNERKKRQTDSGINAFHTYMSMRGTFGRLN